MTEKRFTLKHINEQHISANLYDNGTFIGSIGMGEELITELLNQLNDENEQLKSFKNDVYDLIDELIKKAEKDVEDLKKDAYEKGYAYNPYYYWGVAHGLEKLKKELENE